LPSIQLPALLPGATITDVIPLKCVDPSGSTDSMKIIISAKRRSTPILIAIVTIPPCEPIESVDL
jgi:hypothetical protein